MIAAIDAEHITGKGEKMVQVTLTKNDGTTEKQDFRSWIEMAAWVEHRHWRYTEVEAHEVGADEIRQWREGND